MIKKLNYLFSAVLGVCLMIGSAEASTFLDFTQSQYDPGANSQTVTVPNVLDDIDITFTALGEAGSTPYLSWFTSANPDPSGGDDGYGVFGGGGYETDEVELPEMLLIEFSDAVVVHSFNLTDFFIEQRHGRTYAETGLYSINGSPWNLVYANSASGNGLFTLNLNTALNSIAFTALGDVAGVQDHEFSVAGADITAVPVPPAVLLLGSGILGLGIIRKKIKD
jgi:hypothetical protein